MHRVQAYRRLTEDDYSRGRLVAALDAQIRHAWEAKGAFEQCAREATTDWEREICMTLVEQQRVALKALFAVRRLGQGRLETRSWRRVCPPQEW